MADKFSWTFELIDKASGPARAAADASMGFEKELHKVHSQIERINKNPLEFKKLQAAKKELRELTSGAKSFAERMEEMSRSVKQIGFVQNLSLGIEAFHVLGEAAMGVVEKIAEVGGEMIKAAGHSERFNMAIETRFGEKQGKGLVDYLDQVAEHTELSRSQLKDLSTELAAAGFKANEMGYALTAALDVGGFRGGGLENIQAAVASLSKIRESGHINVRNIKDLGLGEKAAQNLMLRLAGGDKSRAAELNKQMENGTLDLKAPINEIYKTIAENEGGTIGTMAEKMRHSVLGSFEKVKGLPEEFFESWEKSPAFKKVGVAFDKIFEKLKPGSEGGDKILAAMDKVSGQVVDMLNKLADGKAIDNFINGLTRAVPLVERIAKAMFSVVSVMARVAGGAESDTGARNKIDALKNMDATWDKVRKAEGIGYFKNLTMSADSRAAAVAKAFSEGKITAEDVQNAGPMGEGILPPSARVKPGNVATNQTANINEGAIVLNVNGGNTDEIQNAISSGLPGAVALAFTRMNPSSAK